MSVGEGVGLIIGIGVGWLLVAGALVVPIM